MSVVLAAWQVYQRCMHEVGHSSGQCYSFGASQQSSRQVLKRLYMLNTAATE